jgi:hypothetical protein
MIESMAILDSHFVLLVELDAVVVFPATNALSDGGTSSRLLGIGGW